MTTAETRVVILVDTYTRIPRLRPSFGFAALVVVGDTPILLDVGPDYGTLAANAAALGIDLDTIQCIVISHWHGDHAAALPDFLERHSTRVITPTPPPSRISRLAEEVVVARHPVQIAPGAWSTGVLGYGVPEQSLIAHSPKGPVVVVGCSHPGISAILQRAARVANTDFVYALIGGYHTSDSQTVIRVLRDFRVQVAVPTHCTPSNVIDAVRQQLPEAFHEGGVGASFSF